MDSNPLTLPTSSQRRAATENFQRLLSKPNGELRLQGTSMCRVIESENLSMMLTPPMFMVICRLRELHTLKGHVESVFKLKGLDIDNIQQHYTV